MTGGGWGKNRTAAEFVTAEAKAGRARRTGLICRTAADTRDVAVEAPESGLLAVGAAHRFRPVWQPATCKLVWPNGAVAITYTAEEPDVLRGPQHDLLWGDEVATWARPEAWSNALLGLRLGDHPRWIVTTTPKAVPLLIDKQMGLLSLAIPLDQWVERVEGGAGLGSRIILVQGSTYEIISNLAEPYIEQVIRPYEGTRLGAQELRGQVLEDNPDALWNRARLDALRVSKAPDLRRVVVAVDPAVTAGEGSAETGIIVAGLGEDGKGYVVHDASRRAKPNEWASAAVGALPTACRRSSHTCATDSDAVVSGDNADGGRMDQRFIC